MIIVQKVHKNIKKEIVQRKTEQTNLIS